MHYGFAEYLFLQITGRLMISGYNTIGAAMIQTLGRLLITTLISGLGLYLLWQFMERFSHYMIRRRRAKVRKEAGGDAVCRWGVDASGGLYRVRTQRLPED